MRLLYCLILVTGLGLLLWVLAAPLWVILMFTGAFDDPADGFRDATDAELIEVFRARRPEIERLRAMHREDRGIGAIGTDNIARWWRIGDRWEGSGTEGGLPDRAAVLAAVGLASERDAEYRRLFTAVGVYRVYDHDARREGYDTELCLTRRGTVVRGIMKSYVFAPGDVPPTPLTPRPGDPDEERFIRLGDGWYLRYLDH